MSIYQRKLFNALTLNSTVKLLELDVDNLLAPVQIEQVSFPLLDILEWIAGIALEYCHTRLYLEVSAKLKIWQILACKIGLQSGIIL